MNPCSPILAAWAILGAGAALVGAAPPPASAPPVVALKSVDSYRAGARALAASLPAVAARHFREALATAHLADPDKKELSLLILEACVRSGDITGIESITSADLPATTASEFWMAQALAMAGHLADAESRMAAIARSGDPKWSASAAIARSALLVALKEPSAAIEALAPATRSQNKRTAFRATARQAELQLLLGSPAAARDTLATLKDPPTPVEGAIVRYLSARAAMAAGDAAAADEIFVRLVDKPDGLPTAVVDACRLGTATALLVQGNKERAVAAAARFISQHPESNLVPEALDLVFRGDGFAAASLQADIESWVQSPHPTLACSAAVRRAESLRQSDPSAAASMIEKAMAAHPASPMAADLALTRCSLLADAGRKDEAASALATLQGANLPSALAARRSFLQARLAGVDNAHHEAAKLFLEAAPSGQPDATAAALFNAGLHALLVEEGDTFESAVDSLARGQGHAPELGARLLLERGLYLSTRDPGLARLMLWRYLEAAPTDPERCRANLTLAEISLRESPPQIDKAENQLGKIDDSAPPPIRRQRDYLRVWAAEKRGDVDAALAASSAFLARWPDSSLAEEVRFKVGESLAAAGRHSDARQQFAVIADNPDSPLREAALFHSGLSAALNLATDSVDAAIATFQKVVDLKGPLRFLARRHQALALRRQGKTEAAAKLLNETLEGSDPPPPDERRAMVMLLAELILDSATADAQSLREAVRLFALVRNDASAPATERNRAAWFLGRAADQSGQPEVAAATWFDAADSALTSADGVFDDWSLRCGLSLVDLQGRQGNWSAAAALADRLGRSPHPRAADARALAERIRLQHFLFDEDPKLLEPPAPTVPAPQ